MSRTGILIVLIVSTAVILSGISCRKGTSLSELEDENALTGDPVTIDAKVIIDRESVESLLKCYPPDSGVVPVYVSVKNNGSTPFQIHSLNYLPLPDQFRGFKLYDSTATIDPIHPLEVVMYMKGKASTPNYKKIGWGHAVGGIVFPPLGIYYIFKSVDYSRGYKPLLDKSFFRAERGGSFHPVVVSPGETTSGFLYFPLGPPGSPINLGTGASEITEKGVGTEYDGSWPLEDLKLEINPSIYLPQFEEILSPVEIPAKVVDICFIREENFGGGNNGRGAYFFLSPRGSGTEKLDLCLADAGDLQDRGTAVDFTSIASLSNKKASIADASRQENRIVCAVNFKKKSRLYLMEQSGAAVNLVVDRRMDHHILKLFPRREGLYLVTADGFCHFCRYDDLKTVRDVKLGKSVDDAMMIRDKIFVFGSKSVTEFGIEEDRPLVKLRSVHLTNSKKVFAGSVSGGIALVHRGRGVLGDTLVIYDPVTLSEKGRAPFPDRTSVITTTGKGVIIQFESEIAIHASIMDDGQLNISEAGYLPFKLRSAGGSISHIYAVSGDDRLYCFPFEAVVPNPMSHRSGGSITVPLKPFIPTPEEQN